MLELYEKLKSDTYCKVTYRDYFSDKNGYLNEKAFRYFTKKLKEETDLPDYYLVCLNVDLRKSNTQSMAVGDYELRKFIISLDGYYVFRIQGEKFNMLITEEQIPEVAAILEKQSDKYTIYYGIVKDKPFKPMNLTEEKEMIRKGITLMFENKGEITHGYKIDTIVGDKGNTPVELQETTTRKFRSTMWYSVIKLTITQPFYKEVTIHAFPVEIKGALQSMPIAVAIFDNVKYNNKYGTGVKFGIDGIRFNLTCRLDREEHLSTALFTLDDCKFEMQIENIEGVCVPATFGKRISPTKQIFPIRQNMTGMYDYILYDAEKEDVEIHAEGVVTLPNGLNYSVFMDDEHIDLIKTT